MSHRIDEPAGRHTLDEYRRLRPGRVRAWWRRTGRTGRVAALVAAALVLGAGVALALFLLLGGISGSVTQGTWSLTLSGAPEPAVVAGTCTASRIAVESGGVTGQIGLDWQGVVEGDECALEVQYHPALDGSNSTDVRLQRFVVPTGLGVSMSPGCGTTVTPSMTADGGASPAPHIVLTLTVEAGAPMSIPLDPLLHGAEWVRASDWDAALC